MDNSKNHTGVGLRWAEATAKEKRGDPWYVVELRAHWGEGVTSHDTRRAALTALNEREKLLRLAERVARLNPAAGEIGPGMLASLVAEARTLVGD